ncbi:MAG: thiol peroxidase [Lentimonas sp.]|jgi:thiol peroxidase
MAKVALGGEPCNTNGEVPKVGAEAPNFLLRKNDLSWISLDDLKGSRVILNIFPSVDTGTCATSVRTFNKKASELANTKVVCVSRDLPFAQKRFCGAEGIEDVMTLSDFETGQFGKDYGVELLDGAFMGIHARAIVVLNDKGVVLHTELVPEIANEPNYESAIASLKE